MNLDFITEFYVPIVVVACLIVGYVIKNTPKLEKISNSYIPLIVAILGAILACIDGGVSLNMIVAGAVSGLASTGLYETFRNLVGNKE